ncbi:MAG: hypothetical protein AB1861_08485 [Cyanobacteriota bacterium]
MDYNRLRHEILENPENLGYAGKTHDEIAELLNAKTRSRLEPIPISESLTFLMRHDLLKKIDATPINSPIYSIVNGIRASFQMSAVQLDRPEVDFALSLLVTHGFITEEQKQELFNIATVKVSRAEELNLGSEVWSAHVTEALGE